MLVLSTVSFTQMIFMSFKVTLGMPPGGAITVYIPGVSQFTAVLDLYFFV